MKCFVTMPKAVYYQWNAKRSLTLRVKDCNAPDVRSRPIATNGKHKVQNKKGEMTPINVSISAVEDNINDIHGISGIRISNDWILTHGMLLNSKIIHNTELFNVISALVPGELTHLPQSLNQIDFRVRIQTRSWTEMTTAIVSTTTVKQTNKEKGPNEYYKIFEKVNGSIIYIWRCPLLTDTLENLFYAWKIYKILSHLIDDTICLQNPTRGALIEIESTPFGNPIFIDSISQGIVSNVLGTNNCVMLTDANAAPGCEGGPVYLIDQEKSRVICGMVIAPLSWCRSEWVYYTFVACIIPCLRRLLKKWKNIKNVNGIVEQKLTDQLDRGVVLIRCGAEWGSGILLDRDTGTILTCSHVVNEAANKRIRVIFHCNTIDNYSGMLNIWAKLIYRTPNGQPYDVAVLKVDSKKINCALNTLKIGDCNVQRGELVMSAGFPFFSSTLPTITRGNVSNVSAYMLQTTCCIQSGASGGPIVRFDTGELLGMVVCNVISSNTLYPRLNMALPAAVFKDPINEYIKTGDVSALTSLSTHDIAVLRTWNFHLSSKI
ncbi:hypothetical protein PV327_007317 [Microctonus hyperodae]|uniref:Peroxisomal leader peptide-processing protease n=1 Tax=Microctonus hyperodae TaxID=165561 RepID=A0AA39F651_MICHY|nr:hypothetical protein PV327_007317 [Microctonus hyperodae]